MIIVTLLREEIRAQLMMIFFRMMMSQNIKNSTFKKGHNACDQCPKMFPFKSRLMIHQQVNTGKRPCTCDECPKELLKQKLQNYIKISMQWGPKVFTNKNKKFKSTQKEERSVLIKPYCSVG